MSAPAPSIRVPYTRSIIATLVPMILASSNTDALAASALEAKVERRGEFRKPTYLRVRRREPSARG